MNSILELQMSELLKLTDAQVLSSLGTFLRERKPKDAETGPDEGRVLFWMLAAEVHGLLCANATSNPPEWLTELLHADRQTLCTTIAERLTGLCSKCPGISVNKAASRLIAVWLTRYGIGEFCSLTTVECEMTYRRQLMALVRNRYGDKPVPPSWYMGLRVYRGGKGIYVDKERTCYVADDAVDGATVALLHTDSDYPDDLADDSMLYQYPGETDTHSRMAVAATRKALELRLPVFVLIAQPSGNDKQIRFGWIVEDDPESRHLLVRFVDEQPPLATPDRRARGEFVLAQRAPEERRPVLARPGHPQFKLHVLREYGPKCAVCDIALPELLDAAHIVAWKDGGPDEAGNGLVLCSLHHRAFDAGLFGIEPDTGVLESWRGLSLPELRITESVLAPMRGEPHPEALKRAWRKARPQED